MQETRSDVSYNIFLATAKVITARQFTSTGDWHGVHQHLVGQFTARTPGQTVVMSYTLSSESERVTRVVLDTPRTKPHSSQVRVGVLPSVGGDCQETPEQTLR